MTQQIEDLYAKIRDALTITNSVEDFKIFEDEFSRKFGANKILISKKLSQLIKTKNYLLKIEKKIKMHEFIRIDQIYKQRFKIAKEIKSIWNLNTFDIDSFARIIAKHLQLGLEFKEIMAPLRLSVLYKLPQNFSQKSGLLTFGNLMACNFKEIDAKLARKKHPNRILTKNQIIFRQIHSQQEKLEKTLNKLAQTIFIEVFFGNFKSF